MSDDLFDGQPEPQPAPPPRRTRVASPPPYVAPPVPRDRAVASFACFCGAQSEVVEPAPDTVDCWSCKIKLGMHRWYPPYAPPVDSARAVTEEETARIGA